MTFYQNGSSLLRLQLLDENELPIDPDSIDALTFTLYNKADNTQINGRLEQDILDANGGTVAADLVISAFGSLNPLELTLAADHDLPPGFVVMPLGVTNGELINGAAFQASIVSDKRILLPELDGRYKAFSGGTLRTGLVTVKLGALDHALDATTLETHVAVVTAIYDTDRKAIAVEEFEVEPLAVVT